MLNCFYLFFRTRKAWLLLTISSCILEIIGLYFQHNIGFKPCVLCIYERIALFGLIITGLIAIINPKGIFRYAALILWLYSSWHGLNLALEHIRKKFFPSPFESCDFFVKMPSWLPLNQYFPAIFEAYSDCTQKQWSFLKIEMSIWLLIVFIIYFLLAIIVLLSQFSWFKQNVYSK